MKVLHNFYKHYIYAGIIKFAFDIEKKMEIFLNKES